jgi:RNA polymerase sigma factor (sigma-70 family)
MVSELMEKPEPISGTTPADEEAICNLFRTHAPMVLRNAFRILKDRSLAEDVLQETFLRIHRIKDRMDASQNIAGLLRKISVNISIDMLRKRCREISIDYDEAGNNMFALDISPPLTQADAGNPLLVRQVRDSRQCPSLPISFIEIKLLHCRRMSIYAH